MRVASRVDLKALLLSAFFFFPFFSSSLFHILTTVSFQQIDFLMLM